MTTDPFPVAELVAGPVTEEGYRFYGVRVSNGLSSHDYEAYRVPRLLCRLYYVRRVVKGVDAEIDGFDTDRFECVISVSDAYDDFVSLKEINRNLAEMAQRETILSAVTLGLKPGQVLVFCGERVSEWEIDALESIGDVDHAMISRDRLYNGQVIELLVPAFADLNRGDESTSDVFADFVNDVEGALTFVYQREPQD